MRDDEQRSREPVGASICRCNEGDQPDSGCRHAKTELSEAYDGPVVQPQDLTVFNLTKEAVVARQANVMEQLPPIPGKQRATFSPVAVPPPAWWAEALIPLD
jgi:hypothetical protein